MKTCALRRVLSILLIVAFVSLQMSVVWPTRGYAQVIPEPGTPVQLTPAHAPTMLVGINVYPDQPLEFDFIFRRGETVTTDAEFQQDVFKIINYFLVSLTLPSNEMWVNLSPNEKDRIIPDQFGRTIMGQDVLVQDYFLKQLSATLMNPESALGEAYWTRLYDEMYERTGSTQVPADTFNKIWIVPDRAEIFEHKQGAVLVDSHLKVMLEKDYLSHAKQARNLSHAQAHPEVPFEGRDEQLQSEVMREVMLPAIEREVNEGEIFVNLRQIHSAMILASWYKNNLKKSLLSQLYVDQNKTDGLKNDDPQAHLKLYQRYLTAFEKGVCNIIREEYDPVTQQILPRKYFSGGVELDDRYESVTDSAMLNIRERLSRLSEKFRVDVVRVALEGVGDNTNMDLLKRVSAKAADYYRQFVPRSAHDDWTVEETSNFTREGPALDRRLPSAATIFEDFMASFKEKDGYQRMLDMVRSITGVEIAEEELTKGVRAGYFASGSHKDVYLVEFEKKRGPPVEMAIVLKREQVPGAIATNEVSDLQRLHRIAEAEGVRFAVPRLGEAVVTDKGMVMYAEEFIKGPTAEELYLQGQLGLETRRNLVRNLFDIGQAMGDNISIPVDIHRRNWVIRNAEAIMVDIGKRRTYLLPRGKVTNRRGQVQDFRRSKVFMLMSLMHHYGYKDGRDQFIFDAIRESLGDEDAQALFKEVIEYMAEQEDLLTIVRRKSGRQFLTLGADSDGDISQAFQDFIDGFQEIFSDYLDNPDGYVQKEDYKGLNRGLIATMVLLSLLALQKDSMDVDPEVLSQLEKLQPALTEPSTQTAPSDTVSEAVEPRQYFQHQNILSLNAQGPAVEEFKTFLKELYNVEQITAAVNALKGQSNPVTGRPYVISDPQGTAEQFLETAGFDRSTETVVVAFQHQWGITEDGDVGGQTRKVMVELLQARDARAEAAAQDSDTDRALLTEAVQSAIETKASFTTAEVLTQLGLDQARRAQVVAVLAQLPNVTNVGEDRWQNKVGGIDLNPQWLEVQIQKQDSAEILFVPIPQDLIGQMEINGFVPRINQMTPIQSLPQYLGLTSAP